MTVSELLETIQFYKNEICCDKEKIASHDIKSRVIFFDEENEKYYKVKEIQPSRLFGCGCWDGIVILLKEDMDNEDND